MLCCLRIIGASSFTDIVASQGLGAKKDGGVSHLVRSVLSP